MQTSHAAALATPARGATHSFPGGERKREEDPAGPGQARRRTRRPPVPVPALPPRPASTQGIFEKAEPVAGCHL